MRRSISLLSCILTAICASVCLGTRYEIKDLGNINAMFVNNNGTVAGYVKSTSSNAAVFKNNHLTVYDIPNSVPSSLNNSDSVVLPTGIIQNDIYTSDDPGYSPFCINDRGQFVEISNEQTSTGYPIYLNDNGTRQLIDCGTVFTLIPLVLNNNGQIFLGNGLMKKFYIWENSVAMLVPVPAGMQIRIRSMNDSGDYVGSYTTSQGATCGFMHTAAGMILTGSNTNLESINNSGQVVGSGNGTAMIWENGTNSDLNSLVTSGSGWKFNLASWISDNGYIVGTGLNPDGQTSSFLLTPVPEPSSILLFIAGIAAIRKRIRFFN